MISFQKKAFIALVVLQLVVLSAMIGQRMYLVKTGKVIRLQCQPVDPRSLFSGDYVILTYKISQLKSGYEIPWKKLNSSNLKFKSSDVIYCAVKKKKNSPFWMVVRVHKDLDKLQRKYDVIMRGRVMSTYNMRIQYGVESYFVPQYEGKKIEKQIEDVSIDVSVNSSGVSAIKTLYIKGKEVEFK